MFYCVLCGLKRSRYGLQESWQGQARSTAEVSLLSGELEALPTQKGALPKSWLMLCSSFLSWVQQQEQRRTEGINTFVP